MVTPGLDQFRGQVFQTAACGCFPGPLLRDAPFRALLRMSRSEAAGAVVAAPSELLAFDVSVRTEPSLARREGEIAGCRDPVGFAGLRPAYFPAVCRAADRAEAGPRFRHRASRQGARSGSPPARGTRTPELSASGAPSRVWETGGLCSTLSAGDGAERLP